MDSGFLSADFRATEKTGQLILQVAGRAGRHASAGEVVIQTRMPDHPLLGLLINNHYDDFAKAVLQERDEANLPPITFSALVRAESKLYQKAEDLLQLFKKKLQQTQWQDLEILGPCPALIEKKQNRYRVQLLLISAERKTLHNAVRILLSFAETQKISRALKWSVEIDPSGVY
jgi:primosomal protein N' (replication factor Y) (superfamily II helicase)